MLCLKMPDSNFLNVVLSKIIRNRTERKKLRKKGPLEEYGANFNTST